MFERRYARILVCLVLTGICKTANAQGDTNGGPEISVEDVNAAGVEAIRDVERVEQLESELARRGLVLRRGSAASFHRSLFRGDPQVMEQTRRSGLIETQTAVNLARRLQTVFSREQIERVPLNDTVISDVCPKPPRCLETRYRAMDGSCNNKDNLNWGRSFTALQRLLPPDYDDGISMPRTTGVDRRPLPSARLITSRISRDVSAPSARISVHFMQWGQFIDHDITNTALTLGPEGTGITCCDEEVLRNQSLRHPACLPIDVPEDDPFFSTFGLRCMEFVRSEAAPRDACTLGPRLQFNMLTSFIDGSLIYGSTLNESTNLRSLQGGRLRGSPTGGENVLPPDDTGSCITVNEAFPCFAAGDFRVNEQSMLAIYHQIWFREHNRIAGILARMNPGWSDEALYQESRRIIGAMMQHITYNEFLPHLLGQRLMGRYRLNVQWDGYSDEYDPKVNPSMTNGFASAAYRLGHTLIEGVIPMISQTNEVTRNFQLRSLFFNPEYLYDESPMDMLIRGMSATPSQNYDSYVTREITEHLFEPPGQGYGLDLDALSIQRGRDHGLPPYNRWREFCGLPRVQNFDQLASYISPETTRIMRELYGDVDDLDLYITGVSERPADRDSILGSTFGCIVAEQFRRLKVGDRFWYENGKMESSFSPAQLKEIRKVTFSRVLCDNSNIQAIQKFAMLLPGRRNPVENCVQGKIPRMDLEPWRNEPIWEK